MRIDRIDPKNLYRARAGAIWLGVSVATIYRAVDRGELRALRVGTGKGTIRIPGDALIEYKDACERAAATRRPASTESTATTVPTAVLGGDAA
jgi:excisionase family DNA binding protein